MARYRFHWRDGKKSEGEGPSAEVALSTLGYGFGAIPALDYWELIEEKRTNYAQRRRVRVRKGWDGEGSQGTLYFSTTKDENLGQSWSMVLFDECDDPECFKTEGLEDLSGMSLIAGLSDGSIRKETVKR